MNLSVVDDERTARTDPACAIQRAENLAILGARRVLELCVGPSLRSLQAAYAKVGISVTGNDIEERWRQYFPTGNWIIGDALAIDWSTFDAVVFAPPLSHGCTGQRDDALSVAHVQPAYNDFVRRATCEKTLYCMVLPARALATRADRNELHDLLAQVPGAEVVPLVAGRRQIRKYVDVYFRSGVRTRSRS